MERPTDLIREIDLFIERHKISPVTFGREAMRDPHFVRDVRNGRRLWPETEAKVRAFMDSYVAPVRTSSGTVVERAAA
jgi:2,4-dienoyl-CoA reductase-like NADH-dependent reductase (Old Yellow Enzyme family)